MKQIQTLTIDETLTIFRQYGVPMSYEKLVAWIDNGAALNWAVSARRGKEGNYQRTIFAKPLIAWLDSLAGEVSE